MISTAKAPIAGAAAFLAAALGVSSAQAGIEACGNIDISAQASCTVEYDPPACEASCEQVSFQAACQGQCDVALPSCSASCQADCEGGCNVNPGSFECTADCNARCTADCQGQCASSVTQTECQGQCTQDCSGQCNATCQGTPPSADCKASCQASCQGACTAGRANCQARCEATLKGGCHAKCREGQGAVFCDGNYVEHGDNLQRCIDALKSLGANVSAHASGQCSGNTCTGEAGCSLSTVPQSDTSGWPAALGLLGMAGGGAGGMLRRKLLRRRKGRLLQGHA